MPNPSEGQLFQIGFMNTATNYEGSGIFYDNLEFGPPSLPVAVDINPGTCPNLTSRKAVGDFVVALVADGACNIVNTLRSADFVVEKYYSDDNTDPVSVSLTCSDGTVTASPLDAAPGSPAMFEVTGYEGEPTCTATEDVPAGYDGDETDCVAVPLLADGTCTIANSLRTVEFTVTKEYSDGNTDPVSVSLTCSDGDVTVSRSEERRVATEGRDVRW